MNKPGMIVSYCISCILLYIVACDTSPKPNIILMVADDMGWADIGYHNQEIKTPTLDRLALEGVELDQHYVQPQCTPTRVALMTGRYPNRFGGHCTKASNLQAFPFGTVTMASALGKAGYTTAISGKWHLGSLPEWGPRKYGFDHSHGSFAGAVGMYDHRYRLSQPQYANTWHFNDQYFSQEGHATDLCTDQVVKWIGELKTPYFIYVPFHTVHTPLVEAGEWLEMNQHIADPDRRLMAAALSHLDNSVKRIFEAVESSGQMGNTLFIFFSDNGGIHTAYNGGNYPEPDPALKIGFSSNYPLRGGKTTVYEGGIRVPAFVFWRGKLKNNKITIPVHVVDWMPTICNLVGYDPPADLNWDGRDIWPVIAAEQKSYGEPRSFYWHWAGDKEKPGRIAVRNGNYKLVIPEPGSKEELYNLDEDPGETNDLAGQKGEVLMALKKLLAAEQLKDK